MARKKKVKRISKKNTKNKFADRFNFNVTGRKIWLVAKNLIIFIILTAISYILSRVSEGEVYQNFFDLLWIILGFVSLAFFIVLLILLFLKLMKK